MSVPDSVVVIGAGQAGGRCVEALRQGGFAGRISLIGDEAHLPYERPPLSKEMLAADGADKIAWVRPAAWYDETRIERHLGRRAERIDRDRKLVVLDDGSEIAYGALVLATGARPRHLTIPGAEHAAVQVVRTIEDTAKLLPALAAGKHVVVIGAGFIGLESAAAARARGADVVVLEMAPRVLARGVSAELAAWFDAEHRRQGVRVFTGAVTTRIETTPSGAVVHTETDTFPADAIVVGIGVIPNVELAETAGITTKNGIVVDLHGRTSDPAIWSCGDCTQHPNPILGVSLRLESWQNAQNQAIAVAKNILGETKDYAEVPWFWSDQFGHNLQIAGLADDSLTVIARGTLGEGQALRFFLRDGVMVGAIGLDAPRDLRFAKELIAVRATPQPAQLADPAVKLADLLKAAKAARAT